MFRSRFGFGRRRRPARVGLIVLFVALFVGYDYAASELQKRQEWSGWIERTYSSRGILSTNRTRSKHYWEVRSSDGELHTVRIYSSATWSAGWTGAPVIKTAGELDPIVTSVH
jgi:hypothetical protein